MHAVGSVAGRSGAHPFQRGAVTAWRDDGEACVGPQRNQLVWIDTQGWKALRDREWDTEAGSRGGQGGGAPKTQRGGGGAARRGQGQAALRLARPARRSRLGEWCRVPR